MRYGARVRQVRRVSIACEAPSPSLEVAPHSDVVSIGCAAPSLGAPLRQQGAAGRVARVFAGVAKQQNAC